VSRSGRDRTRRILIVVGVVLVVLTVLSFVLPFIGGGSNGSNPLP